MNETEIRQLLAVAMAYDNRKPGQAAVLAWGEAARRARWTFEAAMDAVHAHYAESTEFLMPAHITQRLRAGRRAEAEQYQALPPAAPASEEARQRAMEMVRQYAARFSMPRDVPRTARPQRTSAEYRAAREAALAQLNAARPDLNRLLTIDA